MHTMNTTCKPPKDVSPKGTNMTSNNKFEEHMKTLIKLEEKQNFITKLIQECNDITRNLKNNFEEYKEPLRELAEKQNFITKLAQECNDDIKILQNTSNKGKTPTSATTDEFKFSPEFIEAYQMINKFYGYKTSNSILRLGKTTQYPRFICAENANPTTVHKLFTYGFIDKIIVNSEKYNISKLPTIILESATRMMEFFGKGIYGIQIFDASTDLVGKPIIICQMFKIGRNTTIKSDNTNLNMKIPCEIENFQEWLSIKRARGLNYLKSRIERMLKDKRTSIIGHSKGGEVEEIITLYYNTNGITNDMTLLNEMHSKVMNLEYKHAQSTLDQCVFRPKKRKREASPDPFE